MLSYCSLLTIQLCWFKRLFGIKSCLGPIHMKCQLNRNGWVLSKLNKCSNIFSRSRQTLERFSYNITCLSLNQTPTQMRSLLCTKIGKYLRFKHTPASSRANLVGYNYSNCNILADITLHFATTNAADVHLQT